MDTVGLKENIRTHRVERESSRDNRGETEGGNSAVFDKNTVICIAKFSNNKNIRLIISKKKKGPSMDSHDSRSTIQMSQGDKTGSVYPHASSSSHYH